MGGPGTWEALELLPWVSEPMGCLGPAGAEGLTSGGNRSSFHPVLEGMERRGAGGEGTSRGWSSLVGDREQLGRLLVLQGVRSRDGAGGNSSFPSSLRWWGRGLRKDQALTWVLLPSGRCKVTGAEHRSPGGPEEAGGGGEEGGGGFPSTGKVGISCPRHSLTRGDVKRLLAKHGEGHAVLAEGRTGHLSHPSVP